MKKAKILILSMCCLTLCACTNPNTAEPSSTVTTTATPAPVDKGNLSIDSVYAWIGYPDADFCPVFSMPEYAEDLTYTYDSEGLSIDAKKNTVKAILDGVLLNSQTVAVWANFCFSVLSLVSSAISTL